jgi:hypothetical protein
MMKTLLIYIRIFIPVLAIILSAPSFAVVNPESGRKGAPVVLKCLVLSTSQWEEGRVTTYTVNCRSVETLRAPKNLQLPDPLVIRYSADHAAIERQAMDIQRKVAEKPGYAGPGLDLPPRLPARDQVIVAYLRHINGPSDEPYFVPASGDASFKVVESTAPREPKATCAQPEAGPSDSQTKECKPNKIPEDNDGNSARGN